MELNTAKSTATIQSVDRALNILECFNEQEEYRLSEISQKVGLKNSTAYGIVHTLEVHGFLAQNPDTGKYRLGLTMFRLGNNLESSLRSLAKISLTSLVSQFSETANLSIRSGDYNLYLEKLESPLSMRISTAQGQLFPLYVTAMGKCMLAYLSDTEVDDILSRADFTPLTKNTLTSPEKVKAALVDIRKKGYAIDNEEREYGITCIAVPIFDGKLNVIASLSVSGPTMRMTFDKMEGMKDALKVESAKITQQLY